MGGLNTGFPSNVLAQSQSQRSVERADIEKSKRTTVMHCYFINMHALCNTNIRFGRGLLYEKQTPKLFFLFCRRDLERVDNSFHHLS